MHSRSRHYTCRAGRNTGIVSFIALILLAVFATLGMAFAHSTNLNLQASANEARALNARMAAEGGLNFFCYLLESSETSDGSDQEIMDSIADILRSALEGPGCLSAGSITCDGITVTVPTVTFTGMKGALAAEIYMMTDGTIDMKVTGQAGAARRVAGITLDVQGGSGGVFARGVVTNGPITVAGNGRLRGVNNPAEAEVYTATTQNMVFDLSGNSSIEGDVYATNGGGTYSLSGNSKIAGCRAGDPELPDHVNFGTAPFEIPEVDGSPFEPFAVNPVTQTSGNYSLSNIRIPAGTNPQFSGNYTIRGVIYIESPNVVTFTGNTTIEGVIVTEDAGDGATVTNQIAFQGNTTLRGVADLPNTPEYAALRDLPGSMILAPGFALDFHGNFGTISGCMAGDKFTFHGNSGGTMKGSIINYGQTEMIFQGNSTFWFDRSGEVENPSGFSVSEPVLTVVAQSYTEN